MSGVVSLIVIRVASAPGGVRGRVTLITDISERGTERISDYTSPTKLRAAVLAAMAELIGDQDEPRADEPATDR